MAPFALWQEAIPLAVPQSRPGRGGEGPGTGQEPRSGAAGQGTAPPSPNPQVRRGSGQGWELLLGFSAWGKAGAALRHGLGVPYFSKGKAMTAPPRIPFPCGLRGSLSLSHLASAVFPRCLGDNF